MVARENYGTIDRKVEPGVDPKPGSKNTGIDHPHNVFDHGIFTVGIVF
jgi:hypothetical protein